MSQTFQLEKETKKTSKSHKIMKYVENKLICLFSVIIICFQNFNLPVTLIPGKYSVLTSGKTLMFGYIILAQKCGGGGNRPINTLNSIPCCCDLNFLVICPLSHCFFSLFSYQFIEVFLIIFLGKLHISPLRLLSFHLFYITFCWFKTTRIFFFINYLRYSFSCSFSQNV